MIMIVKTPGSQMGFPAAAEEGGEEVGGGRVERELESCRNSSTMTIQYKLLSIAVWTNSWSIQSSLFAPVKKGCRSVGVAYIQTHEYKGKLESRPTVTRSN